MCRWIGYTGAPQFLADMISNPAHSLLEQSLHAEQGKTETNGDGFGLAWYGEKATPGIFRDVMPAWSDQNLLSLAAQVRSPLFMAHVRASTGTEISRTNCHPFYVQNWSFMMNGQIADYPRYRREMDMMIAPELYAYRRGTTDSEALFLIAFGHGLVKDPRGAFARTIAQLEQLDSQKNLLRMTAALSDGKSLFALRYSSGGNSPTLFQRQADGDEGWMVASEPFHHESDAWQIVPENSFCRFEMAKPVEVMSLR